MIKLRTPVFKLLHIATVAFFVLAFALSTAGAGSVQAGTSTQMSAGRMPFAGGLYDAQTNSIASLNGQVHIVTRWTSVSANQAPIDIDVNLPAANVAVTTDTEIGYSAYGAGQSSIIFPNDPVFPNDRLHVIVPSFWLAVVGSDRALPPNPVQPYRFALQFDLVLSAAGVLDLNVSTVQLTQIPGIDGD